MFTGIVEEMGMVRRLLRTGSGYDLVIQAETVLTDTRLGDSVAVNGVCLTVTQLGRDSFTAGLAPETRQRSSLAQLQSGDRVNLERSLTPTSRIGGHFVQGHVDGVGVVKSIRADEDALWVTVHAPPSIMRYIVPKGFIALDGVSLTVVDVGEDFFTVTLVAYTQSQITLPQQAPGYRVNIEVDILGKYIEKQLAIRFGAAPAAADGIASGGITERFLAEHGYMQDESS